MMKTGNPHPGRFYPKYIHKMIKMPTDKEEDITLRAFVKKLFKERRYEDCCKACEPFLAGTEENDIILNYYGVCLMQMGYYLPACHYLQILADKGGIFLFNLEFIGDCFYELGQYEKALQSYDRFLETDTGTASVFDHYARSLFKLNRIDEALFWIDKAIEKDSGGVDAKYAKALFLKQAGRKNEAFVLFGEIRKAHPEDSQAAKQQFGIILESLENLNLEKPISSAK